MRKMMATIAALVLSIWGIGAANAQSMSLTSFEMKESATIAGEQEIDMVFDDSVVHLEPGDTVVRQATNHAWVNHGTENCRILFVLMDSKQP